MTELTNIKSSYVGNLKANKNTFDYAYANPAIKADQLKSIVKNIVLNTNDKTIEDKSEATKRFLVSLDKLRSKDQIMTLVYNSMLKGDGQGVI